MSIRGALDRVRQPEYTGGNRCLPCTAVNILLAGALAVALAALSAPLGVAAFAVSLAAIYLRGYLVPGTPRLTKQYLPERVLRWFDKAPEPAPEDLQDVEAVLHDLGAIEECPDREDLCLVPAFRAEWEAAIDEFHGGDTRGETGRLLGVDPDRLRIQNAGSKLSVYAGRRLLGQWPSRAAHVADVAASRTLRGRDPGWDGRDPDWRAAVCDSLRLFLETCPACGGPVELGEQRVESCCRAFDVAAAECADCGARVFETELPEAQA